MQVNEVTQGFRLIKKSEITEISGAAYEFLHEKTGAKLLFVQNDDDNKVFSVAFRTPPKDDTGVSHIVEHSVLCGSRKYPLKEPFIELAKGSLNTFLNAMTFPDKTVYPIASRNDHDFDNLMDVYLDAVFYPAMYDTPEILMQEGWHYELDDPGAPLRYSGVVYNEMKGALSSPDSILESRVMSSLYPHGTYGFESGGDPKHIPELTQEMFLDFHRRYYHPSNSYIYLYGDLDIEAKLKYLNEAYLSHFERMEIDSAVVKEEPFAEMKRVREYYPCGENEPTKERTYLSLNYAVGDVLNTEDMMALEILDYALIKTAASPLRRALIESELGKDVDSEFESSIAQPFFSIIVEGSEDDRAEKFYKVVTETLQKLADGGLERELVESSINRLEFRLREADFGTAPKGLIYGLNSLRSQLYGGDPTVYIRYESDLAKMKEGLDNGYFEKAIRRLLIDNPHRALVTLIPDKELAKRREAELAEILAQKKAAMGQADIAGIIAANERLLKRQQTPDSPEALNSIPILALSDIRKEAYPLPLEERELNGVKVLFSEIDTHGIVYLIFDFDASVVPQSDLMYLYLLAELLGDIDTADHTYGELNKLIDLHTGGIDFNVTAFGRVGDPDSLLCYGQVIARALVGKMPQLTDLLGEILNRSRFDDAKRLRELILELEANLEGDMQRSAYQLASSRLSGYLTKSGRYVAERDLPFYRFVKDLAANFNEKFDEIKQKLTEVQGKIFRSPGLSISATLTAADYPLMAENLAAFLAKLPADKLPKQEYGWDIAAKNEGLMSASQVQYVVKGANFIKLGYEYNGAMRILETVLRYEYFWTKIRMQGGAYGAFTSFNRNGMMIFGSYRDPKLKETLAVFDSVADFLRGFTISEREFVKAIIGTMSNVDIPLTPKMKGSAAFDLYLRGVTYADRQKSRDEILSARPEDIRALADLVAACMKENNRCVFGNETVLQENADVFDNLVSVMN